MPKKKVTEAQRLKKLALFIIDAPQSKIEELNILPADYMYLPTEELLREDRLIGKAYFALLEYCKKHRTKWAFPSKIEEEYDLKGVSSALSTLYVQRLIRRRRDPSDSSIREKQCSVILPEDRIGPKQGLNFKEAKETKKTIYLAEVQEEMFKDDFGPSVDSTTRWKPSEATERRAAIMRKEIGEEKREIKKETRAPVVKKPKGKFTLESEKDERIRELEEELKVEKELTNRLIAKIFKGEGF